MRAVHLLLCGLASVPLLAQNVTDVTDIENKLKDGTYITSDLSRMGSGGQLTFQKKGGRVRGIFTQIGRSACYEGTFRLNTLVVGHIEMIRKDSSVPEDEYSFEPLEESDRQDLGEFVASSRLLRFPHDMYHDPTGVAATRAARKFNACIRHLETTAPKDAMCGDYSIQTEFSPKDEQYHRYPGETDPPIRTEVCQVDAKKCTVANVFNAFTSEARFAAPTDVKTPIQTCRLVDVYLLGQVRQVIDAKAYAVINYTVEGHTLHPGKVMRKVILANGKIWIVTTGEGVGNFAKANEVLSDALWTNVDEAFVEEFRRTLPK